MFTPLDWIVHCFDVEEGRRAWPCMSGKSEWNAKMICSGRRENVCTRMYLMPVSFSGSPIPAHGMIS